MLRNPNDLQMVMIAHLATDLFLVCAAGSVLGMVYFDSDLEEDLLQTISLSCLVVRPQPHTFFHATPAATTERHCQAPVLTRTVPQQLLLPPPIHQVGMTAITSSQRWFSKEVAVFQREQYV